MNPVPGRLVPGAKGRRVQEEGKTIEKGNHSGRDQRVGPTFTTYKLMKLIPNPEVGHYRKV